MKTKVCAVFSVLLLLSSALEAKVIGEFSFTIDAGNQMLAYGEIVGVSGYYIIDTGCTTEGIFFEEIQSMRELVGSSKEQWALGSTFSSPVYVAEQMKFENALFKGKFRFLQGTESMRKMHSPEIKGIINPCVIDGIIEISFTDRKIRLRDDVPAGYTERIGYDTRQSVNFIFLEANGKPYSFRIDTGHYGNVYFPVNALNNLPGLALFQNYYGVVVYADETNYSNYYVFKQDSFTLFGHTYKNVEIQTSTLPDKQAYGVIGMGILKNYDIIFSPKEQKLFYRPRLLDFFYDRSFSHETYLSGLMKVAYNDEGSLTVTGIVFQSPAWNEGLRPGYKITKINSVDTTGISFNDASMAIQSRQTVEIEFFDEEQKKTRTVSIEPKKLL